MIDDQTRQSYLRYLGGVGLDIYHELLDVGDSFTDPEMRVIGDVFAACRNSLSNYASY
jgi:hypothetical protein